MNQLQHAISQLMGPIGSQVAIKRVNEPKPQPTEKVAKEAVEAERPITVYVGLQRDNFITLRKVVFAKQDLDMDFVLASVILRGRKQVKDVVTEARDENHLAKLCSAMELEDVFKYSPTHYITTELSNLFESINDNVVVLFLDEKTKWHMVSNVKDFVYKKPTLITEVYKQYYKAFYPAEILNKAFSNPKDILRVYDYYEDEEGEHYLMESLFSDSTVIEHVTLPIQIAESA